MKMFFEEIIILVTNIPLIFFILWLFFIGACSSARYFLTNHHQAGKSIALARRGPRVQIPPGPFLKGIKAFEQIHKSCLHEKCKEQQNQYLKILVGLVRVGKQFPTKISFTYISYSMSRA